MKNDFTWYTNALKGERGPISADEPQPGFYENRRKDRQTGKINRDLFAYWHDTNDGSLRCHRNGRDMDELDAIEAWPFASKRPIPEQTYRDVLAGKPWPDDDKAVSETAEDDAEKTAAEKLRDEIIVAKKGVPDYAKIESDEQAGRGQSLRSLLTTLAGKLDKERETLVRPHVDAQRKINGAWNPTIKDAKDQADIIKRALEKWEDDKREAQREAARLAQKAADEENARRAAIHQQKSDDAGQFNEPPPPAPAQVVPEVQSNMPAPSAKISGGSGRAASVSTYYEAEIVDQDAVYQHFKADAALKNLLLQLAQNATNAGIVVPGVTTHERSKIR